MLKRKDDFRDKFRDISIYLKNLGSGTQATVDQNLLLKDPTIQSTDLGRTRTTNLKLVAIKNYQPDKYGNLEGGAIRELNIYYQVLGCPHLVQLLDIDISIILNKIMLRIMIPYHTSDLTGFIKKFSFKERSKYGQLIIDQLSNSLLQLNLKGILHRDIKPDNILIDYEYDIKTLSLIKDPQVYLADFGYSIQLPCNKSYRNIELTIAGTPLYMAPELLTNNKYYNEKADIWSLGITLVEYYLNDIFTLPDHISMDLAKGNGYVGMWYEIIKYLNKDYNILAFQNMGIDDHIDLEKVFLFNGKFDDYNTISDDIIKLITSMLEIQPTKRLNILSRFPNYDICPGSSDELERGDPIGNISIKYYYDALLAVLRVCSDKILNPHTFISAIDLFNRYIHNHEVKDDDLLLTAAVCLFIIYKIMEGKAINPNIFIEEFNKNLTLEQLQQATKLDLFNNDLQQSLQIGFTQLFNDNLTIKKLYKFIVLFDGNLTIRQFYEADLFDLFENDFSEKLQKALKLFNDDLTLMDLTKILKPFENNFDLTQFQETEILILQRSNYMINSCYVDEFIHEISEITTATNLNLYLPGVNNQGRLQHIIANVTYPLLNDIYTEIEKDNKFVGELFSDQLLEYLDKFDPRKNDYSNYDYNEEEDFGEELEIQGGSL